MPILIKLSGKTITDFTTDKKWIGILNNLIDSGEQIILVHGAGNSISEWAGKLGIESRFIDGLRVTDDAMMDVVSAVQSGLINGKLVAALNHAGIQAIGLTGADFGLAVASPDDENLGRVGTPVISEKIFLLKNLLNLEFIPVFSSTALATDGGLMNINADVMAGELGKALSVSKLFYLSDIPGVILDGTVQPELNKKSITIGIESKQIINGMIPKLLSALELVHSGVQKVWIGPGNPEVFENALKMVPGAGTWIVEGE